ncbi:4Fe-4S binding protein [Reichenbachiella carrageenanivorans]|uniref:4Fe-4S binding protein n=1 Tax=Reichenbachiella carrageenanivorans TaxID=2979869 RepID=A0ABY6CVU4_9BACT|nr:4Fe-4S dicluster domain-containing protein [Reichenbachiella carrageenanivorans]UXX78032.1 4Fe-4S binding protein [Reichenbachiella carrageenanivorans]
MNYKLIQNIGLIIFLVGFGAFLISFGSEKYQLTKQTIDQVISDPTKAGLVKSFGESQLLRSYPNAFMFNSELEILFNKINDFQLDRFGLSNDRIHQIVEANQDGNFTMDQAQHAFRTKDAITGFQWESFQTYGSWLDGRSFGSTDELREALQSVQHNIAQYGVLNQKGFNTYEIKELKFQLTKASSVGWVSANKTLALVIVYGLSILGALMYILPNKKILGPPGIKNDGTFHSKTKNIGWIGILLGSFLILFYVVLYFYPEYMTSWILMVDPVSQWLKGADAGRFFLYGFIYTLAILVMGVRMTIKYRHSKYQLWRTTSVMFFQLAFAFLIPEILMRLNQPYFDFKNIWPLDYDFFFDNELNALINHGGLGLFMLGWGVGLTVLGVPIMVYFFGKRWYCSWVCGCGGLAETLGDPFRQLSDKSLKAWRFERISIHSVLVFAVLMTVAVLYTYWTGESELLGVSSYKLRAIYGSWIGAGFAGVVGTGFYPLMGNRVWCRFGCPLAAYLGLVQRFQSRFRITTNGGQCISCGNCSTYCEMGIDVRAYAQRGENIVRSSCVGCGVCSSVCPRGVLNLENRADNNRFETAGLIGNDSFPEIKK